jgi:hypothetical protein
VYPRLKEFERVCDEARIRFPIDHLVGGRTELTVEAVRAAFGSEFAERYYQK